jgi:Putative prokaryotic signal transducing protein
MAAKAMQDQTPNPNEKLVKVFESESESEAMVVKGLLDSAGIDNDLMSGSLVQETFPGLGGVVILVREEDAEQARQIIAESREALAAGEATDIDDDDSTAELPAAE